MPTKTTGRGPAAVSRASPSKSAHAVDDDAKAPEAVAGALPPPIRCAGVYAERWGRATMRGLHQATHKRPSVQLANQSYTYWSNYASNAATWSWTRGATRSSTPVAPASCGGLCASTHRYKRLRFLLVYVVVYDRIALPPTKQKHALNGAGGLPIPRWARRLAAPPRPLLHARARGGEREGRGAQGGAGDGASYLRGGVAGTYFALYLYFRVVFTHSWLTLPCP